MMSLLFFLKLEGSRQHQCRESIKQHHLAAKASKHQQLSVLVMVQDSLNVI